MAAIRTNKKEEASQRYGAVNKKGFVTIRALAIAVICLSALAYVQPRAELAAMCPESDVRIAPQPFGLMILLTLLGANKLLKRVCPKKMISTQEMISIYVMLVFGGFILSRGLTTFSMTTIMAIHMLSIQKPKVYEPLKDALSKWIIPSSRDAALGFWRGTLGYVPWNEWIIPIVVWTLVYLGGFFLALCMLVVVRKRWVEIERLNFPLNQPVLALIGEETEDGIEAFWTNPLVLAGMIWPVIYHGLGILNSVFPGIPTISGINLGNMFTEPPFHVLRGGGSDSPWMVLDPDPLLIGIGYLVPSNFMFTALVFYGIRLVSYVIYGIQGRYNANTWWMFKNVRPSIVIILSVYTTWICREQIKNIVFTGVGLKKSTMEDEDEPISFKFAFWGSIVVGGAIVFFAYYFLHVPPGWTIASYLLAYSGFLIFAKIRAEIGYPHASEAQVIGNRFLSEALGPKYMSTKSTFGLIYLDRFRGGPDLGLILEANKFADQVGLSRRSITKALSFIIVFTIIVGFVSGLVLFYDYGANNMSHWHIQVAKQYAFDWVEVHETEWVESFRLETWAYVICGGLITLVLSFMTSRFTWWPLHPLGFYTGCSPWMSYFWSGFLIAWLIKSFVLRYGGYSAFKRLRPVFLAMIAGSAIMNIIGTIVSLGVILIK